MVHLLVQQNTYKSVKVSVHKTSRKICKTLVKLSFLDHHILEKNLMCIFPWNSKVRQRDGNQGLTAKQARTAEQLRQEWDERGNGEDATQQGARRRSRVREPELGATPRWYPATDSRSHGGVFLSLKTFSETPFKLCVATRVLAVCFSSIKSPWIWPKHQG